MGMISLKRADDKKMQVDSSLKRTRKRRYWEREKENWKKKLDAQTKIQME